MTIKNLWGDIEIPKEKSPVTILHEQSQLLEKMTNGLLTGRIDNSSSADTKNFTYQFSINAPSLNNYSYVVLTVRYGIELYPVDITQGEYVYEIKRPRLIDRVVPDYEWQHCEDSEAFESELEKIFSSPEVRRVITGLLAQIQST